MYLRLLMRTKRKRCITQESNDEKLYQLHKMSKQVMVIRKRRTTNILIFNRYNQCIHREEWNYFAIQKVKTYNVTQMCLIII